MKTRLSLGAITMTGAVLLTLMSGLAQAQSPSASMKAVERAEGKAEGAAQGGVASQFVSQDRFFTGVCTIGPRGGDVLFRCFNIGFRNGQSVRNVHCQTRNDPAQFINWPDQFSCQVIGTTAQDNGSVWVRIRRMDDGTGASGWGQNLKINLLVVD